MRTLTIKWKPIKGTNKLYWISNNGQFESRINGIRRTLKPRIIKKRKEDKGHLRVTVRYPDKEPIRYLVHRLVGEYFVPNPDNLPQINHEDGDKHNNWYTNLKWSTQSYNMWHAYHVLGKNQDFNIYDKSGINNPAHKAKIRKLNSIK